MIITMTKTSSGALCPTCGYLNDMPFECLRETWEDMECGRCGISLEYKGVHVQQPWQFEINTRIKVKSRDLHLPLKAVYFDQIKSGEKVWEYRLINDFWKKRLAGREYDRIILTRGYPKGGGVEGETRLTRKWNSCHIGVMQHEHFGTDLVSVFAIDVREPWRRA